ncbi:hypothetical protein AMJ49_00695 [Parcubacteria bacterium DG_74_2]|nr:MAG: hypothetical protein AMJ49_00695 [Parcubacteria bacterium DG_74_2]
MTIPEKKEQPRFRRFLPRGIFTRKSAISRIEFEKIASKGRYIVPGGEGRRWGKEDIKKMIEKDFPREKLGGQISKREFEKRMGELAMEKRRAKTGEEKIKTEQKIRFYRKRFLRGF